MTLYDDVVVRTSDSVVARTTRHTQKLGLARQPCFCFF